MAPRKSTSRAPRPSRPTSGLETAGESSKSTLDLPQIPGPSIPTSITPDYVPSGRERIRLDEEEREAFLHDLVCFHPREVCDQFTERVLEVPVLITNSLQRWAEQKYKQRDGDQPQLEREMNMGLVAIETLLESHVDKAMDKFTAWALRNTFDIPPNVEVVLPWQQGLDFERAQYITSLPKGLGTLSQTLEASRTKLEQARLLAQRLILAEQALDRRLEIAKQRRAEVGFVKEVLASSGLSPLPEKTTQIVSALSSLQESLTPLTDNPYQPSQPASSEKTKAWEMGRQAYLNWAVGRIVPDKNLGGSQLGKKAGLTPSGSDDAREVEGMMSRSEHEGLEKLTRSME